MKFQNEKVGYAHLSPLAPLSYFSPWVESLSHNNKGSHTLLGQRQETWQHAVASLPLTQTLIAIPHVPPLSCCSATTITNRASHGNFLLHPPCDPQQPIKRHIQPTHAHNGTKQRNVCVDSHSSRSQLSKVRLAAGLAEVSLKMFTFSLLFSLLTLLTLTSTMILCEEHCWMECTTTTDMSCCCCVTTAQYKE